MGTFNKTALYNALGIALYIVLVGSVMSNADVLFGNTPGLLGPIAFLSLFTLSATVVGSLVLGKPLMLYLDNKKKEAVSMFVQTVGWMAGFTIVLLASLAAIR